MNRMDSARRRSRSLPCRFLGAAGLLSVVLAAGVGHALPAAPASGEPAPKPAATPVRSAAPASTAAPAAPAPQKEGWAAAPDEALDEQVVAPDSPRASMREFLALAKDGNYEAASRYLELAPGADGAKAARQLKAVLDRHLWIDVELLSPEPLGEPDDRLPPMMDEIGKIPRVSGAAEPVRIVRRQMKDGLRWLFTKKTVDRVDELYRGLRDRWFLENMPPWLLKSGPKDLLLWQWLALPLLIAAAWAVGRGLGWITYRVLARLAARTSASWDDTLLVKLRRPIRMLWALVALDIAVPWLALYQPAEAFITKILRAAMFIAVFWGGMRSADTVADLLLSRWGHTPETTGVRSAVTVGKSVAKILLVGLSLVVVLSELGYPVASLITGLGVGTIALALAAQKTVENLFGSISIGIDKPFRVGDFVRIEDFVGTVEHIGLRSTRVRTLDRTVITIPNGRLADMRVESFAERDRIRLAFKLGLVYETTAAQMREVLAGLERVLREQPKIWPDSVTVRFESFADSSLNIEIMAWFMTSEASEFQAIRQEVLLSFMDVVEKAGTSFAFPTRTIHLAHEDRPAPARREGEGEGERAQPPASPA